MHLSASSLCGSTHSLSFSPTVWFDRQASHKLSQLPPPIKYSLVPFLLGRLFSSLFWSSSRKEKNCNTKSSQPYIHPYSGLKTHSITNRQTLTHHMLGQCSWTTQLHYMLFWFVQQSRRLAHSRIYTVLHCHITWSSLKQVADNKNRIKLWLWREANKGIKTHAHACTIFIVNF